MALSRARLARTFAVVAIAALQSVAAPRASAQSAPLALEAKIPLGSVEGRIDHLAVDLKRRLLFVAELGNDTVGIVDVDARKVVGRVTDLAEPQGVAYDASSDTLYVANGGDGSLRMFRGPAFAPAGRIEVGPDADNVRLDAENRRAYCGYGDGALAVIDLATSRKIAEVRLPAHPESFQLETSGSRIFVNVPGARGIAVIDRSAARLVATWPAGEPRANFPMAVDRQHGRILVGFRQPPSLGVFDSVDGKALSMTAACGDTDDVFVDAARGRVYLSCGAGVVEVLASQGDGYRTVARVPTAEGARTALFSPELDRLFVAVRAGAREPAAVWMFQPQ